jgi:hypothetical protein
MLFFTSWASEQLLLLTLAMQSGVPFAETSPAIIHFLQALLWLTTHKMVSALAECLPLLPVASLAISVPLMTNSLPTETSKTSLFYPYQQTII